MPKIKCEQCGTEVFRPRPQPYCCIQCFRLAENKRKTEYIEFFHSVISSPYFRLKIGLYRESKIDEKTIVEYTNRLKKECFKGSHIGKTTPQLLQFVEDIVIPYWKVKK